MCGETTGGMENAMADDSDEGGLLGRLGGMLRMKRSRDWLLPARCFPCGRNCSVRLEKRLDTRL